MWKPYLKVIAECAGQAVHVLDRYHVMAKMNKAIEEVRAEEARRLVADGHEPVLKHSRWVLLKRPENLTENQTAKLKELLRYNLKSVRAYLLRGGVSSGFRSTVRRTGRVGFCGTGVPRRCVRGSSR